MRVRQRYYYKSKLRKSIMNKELFNSAAKWALLLGVCMSLSRIFEAQVLMSGEITKFAFLTFEWIGALLLYVYIVYRATKSRVEFVMSEMAERGYRLGQVVNYSILVSALAAVIIGVSSHIFVVNFVGGYDVYAERSAESILSVVRDVEVSDELLELYETSAETIRESGKSTPNIVSTMISMVANYIISGFIVGLIVGIFTRRMRAPQIKNGESVADEQQ